MFVVAARAVTSGSELARLGLIPHRPRENVSSTVACSPATARPLSRSRRIASVMPTDPQEIDVRTTNGSPVTVVSVAPTGFVPSVSMQLVSKQVGRSQTDVSYSRPPCPAWLGMGTPSTRVPIAWATVNRPYRGTSAPGRLTYSRWFARTAISCLPSLPSWLGSEPPAGLTGGSGR